MLRYIASGIVIVLSHAIAMPTQARSGLYLGGHVGFNFDADSDITDDASISGTELAALDFARGTAAGGAIGFVVDPMRIELEITYRENQVSRNAAATTGTGAPSGGAGD